MNVSLSFWSTPAPPPEPFNARYGGRCPFDDCERQHIIEIGDVVLYSGDELMHLRCARRVERGETAPLCVECFCYHNGEC